jgi:hypothetical protein
VGVLACPEPNLPTLLEPVSRVENQANGTAGWYTSKLALQTDLAVWAAPYALSVTDTLSLFIHSTSSKVQVSIYRVGWYQGGGGRLVWSQDSVAASPQPACSAPFPGPVQCPWVSSLRVTPQLTWTSGVHLVKVTNAAGQSALYPFVLRTRNRHDFLAVVPQFTWQAYNTYGGSSLYTTGPDGKYAHFVSFERPYALRGGAGYMYGPGYSNEASVIKWLEREGYDVGYVSDGDVPSIGTTIPAPATGVLFIGHDEYWTMEERTAASALRDAGTHLAFLAGNSAYWRIRPSAGAITREPAGVISVYKDISDPFAASPADQAVRFRDIGLPENALVGAMYQQHAYGGPYPLVVADSGDGGSQALGFLTGTGLKVGDSLPAILDSKAPGPPPSYSLEGDQIVPNGQTPPATLVLFRALYTGGVVTPKGVFETTFYVAPSGAAVFDAGFNEWGRFLSGYFGPSNAAIESVTKNVLEWMRSHSPPAGM